MSAAARTGELPPLSPRAHRLRELVAALEARDAADEAALAALSPRWREHVRELEQRGWVLRLREVQPTAPPRPPTVGTGPSRPTPSSATRSTRSSPPGGFAPFLLHGVTGSGKTEVYLRAIEEALARGQQALVLVPEIGLTPQLVGRFAARFDAPLAVLHSGLDRPRAAARLARGAQRAAPHRDRHALGGVRAAGAAGLIIVDEEHDASYKQQEAASATPRATSRWCAPSSWACRWCSAPPRRRSRPSTRAARAATRCRCRTAAGASRRRAAR